MQLQQCFTREISCIWMKTSAAVIRKEKKMLGGFGVTPQVHIIIEEIIRIVFLLLLSCNVIHPY